MRRLLAGLKFVNIQPYAFQKNPQKNPKDLARHLNLGRFSDDCFYNRTAFNDALR